MYNPIRLLRYSTNRHEAFQEIQDMRNSKIWLFLAMVVFSIVSCTKEDIEGPEVIDPIDPNVEVTETSNNPLMAQVSSDGEDAFDLGCFIIQTPFALNVNGVVLGIESFEDFDNAVMNAGDAAAIDFVYPITITYEDGEVAEIADGMELGETFSACIPEDGWNIVEGGFPAYVINDENSCYNLAYPLTLADLDNNQLTIADEITFIDAMASNQTLFFTFPLTLINQDGEELIALDDQELFELSFDCEGTNAPYDTATWDGNFLGCYNIDFPVSITEVDAAGNEIIVILEELNRLNNALLNGNFIDFSFPMTLIDFEGNAIIVDSQDELDAALVECQDIIIVEPTDTDAFYLFNEDVAAGGSCYDIQYPVNYFMTDSVLVEQANNFPEFQEAIFSSTDEFLIHLIYPVTVVLTADNSTVIIDNMDELDMVLEDCE